MADEDLPTMFGNAVPFFASGAKGTTIPEAMTYAQAKEPVMYDTGPQPGEQQLHSYEPSWRDRMGATIAGDSAPNSARYNFAQGLVGSAGAGKKGIGPWGLSVLDVPSPLTGFGLASPALDMQEASMRGDEQGMKRAAVGLIPGVNVEAKIAGDVESGVAKMLSKAVRPPYERKLNSFGLYSAGAEHSYNLPQEAGTVQQMKAMLDRVGVKPAEFQHSGFDTAFPDPKAKVTRDQLVNHFETNVPKLDETRLGNPLKDDLDAQRIEVIGSNSLQYLNTPADIADARRHNAQFRSSVEGMSDDAILAAAKRLRSYQNYQSPKFERWTLPGGDNYREVLTTFDNTPKEGVGLFDDYAQAYFKRFPRSAISTSELEQYWRRGIQIPKEGSASAPAPAQEYRSSHWNEPNVVGHTRMSDRTGPDGEQILHLEESQSDWGQDARKLGFKDPAGYDAASSKALALQEERKALKQQTDQVEINDPLPEDIWMRVMEAENSAADPEAWQAFNEWNKRIMQKREPLDGRMEQITFELEDLSKEMTKKRSGVPEAPYVGSTPGWTDLNLKRALWEAAQTDAEKLAWTPGVEQAERYGGDEAMQAGMESYYDKMLPSQLRKVLKQSAVTDAPQFTTHNIAGSKFEVVLPNGKVVADYPHVESANAIAKNFEGATVRQSGKQLPALNITPEMREAIKRGLPYFALPAGIGLAAALQAAQQGGLQQSDLPEM